VKAGVAFTMRGNAARALQGWSLMYEKNSPLSHQETNWESRGARLPLFKSDAFCSLTLGEEFKILPVIYCYLNGMKMRSQRWEILIIAPMRRKETNFQGNEALYSSLYINKYWSDACISRQSGNNHFLRKCFEHGKIMMHFVFVVIHLLMTGREALFCEWHQITSFIMRGGVYSGAPEKERRKN